ncbi:MAG: DUF559 domain-containing protein [Archangium sp.]
MGVLALAARQHGVISRAQVLEHLTDEQLWHRVRTGRWQRVYPKVFRIKGSSETWEQSLRALSLWLVKDFLFSHSCAAALHGFRNFQDESLVVSRLRHTRCVEGVRLIHSKAFHKKDIASARGFRVTSVPRTLVDLAGELDAHTLRATADEALSRRWMTLDALEAAIQRAGSAPAVAALRSLLSLYRGGDGPTESELEVRVRELIESRGLPPVVLQKRVRVHGRFRRLDFLFADFKVVVEADGYAYHSDLAAFERDRKRINELNARGYTVLQWTWRSIHERPDELIAELIAVLNAKATHIFRN